MIIGLQSISIQEQWLYLKFAREAQNNGYTKLVYVPTAEQLADGMTKALPTGFFRSICLSNFLHYHEFDEHW